MDNIGKIIKQHNSKITKIDTKTERLCNCLVKANCPLNNKCLMKNVVYSAEVTHNETEQGKVYIGVSEPPFKLRFRNHKSAFNNRSKITDTKLSEYIWQLKDKGIHEYTIKWSILKRAPGYNRKTKACGLCLTEKLMICNYRDRNRLINSRSELVSKCRHQNRYILGNISPNG